MNEILILFLIAFTIGVSIGCIYVGFAITKYIFLSWFPSQILNIYQKIRSFSFQRIKVFVSDIFYRTKRLPKLKNIMREGDKEGNSWGDEQNWALAERLKHSDRGRTPSEDK